MTNAEIARVLQDVADVLANVLKAEPNWTALPEEAPSSLRLCLRQCLQKDRRDRFHDIGDVRLALGGAFDSPRQSTAAPSRRVGWIGWAVAFAAVTTAAVLFVSSRSVDAPETRLEIVTPPAIDPVNIDISLASGRTRSP